MFARSTTTNTRFFDFKSVPIKIILNTNKGKEEVVFTRSMLELRNTELDQVLNVTEEYPLFSDKYEFPVGFFNSSTYSQKMEFFFNKDTFNRVMTSYNRSIVKETRAVQKENLDKKVNEMKTANQKKQNDEKIEKENKTKAELKKEFEEKYDILVERLPSSTSLPSLILQKKEDIKTRNEHLKTVNEELKKENKLLSDFFKKPKENQFQTELKQIQDNINQLTTNINRIKDDLHKLREELFKLYDDLLEDVFEKYQEYGNGAPHVTPEITDLLLAAENFKKAYLNYKPYLASEDGQVGGFRFEPDMATDIQTKNRLIDFNVRILLGFLFPTKYPFRNSYTSSWDTKINHGQLNSLGVFSGLSFSGLLKKFSRLTDEHYSDKYPDFSYLKMSGKTYTVTDVIWISDIYNHTVYQELLKEYNKLIDANQLERTKLKQENNNKKQFFKQKYTGAQKTKDSIDVKKEISNPDIPMDYFDINNIQKNKLDISDLVEKIKQTPEDFDNIKLSYSNREQFIQFLKANYTNPNPINFMETNDININAMRNMSVLDYFIFRISYKLAFQTHQQQAASAQQASGLYRLPSGVNESYRERSENLIQLRTIRDTLYDIQTRVSNIFNKLMLDNPDYDEIYTDILNVKTGIELIQKYATTLSINSEEDKILKKILKLIVDAEPIKLNDYLLDNYFTEERQINFDFLTDTRITQSTRDRYKQYGGFVNLLRKFSNTTRESSNAFLQKTIQEFLDRVGDDFIYMMDQDTLYNTDIQREFTNYLERFHTGVSIVAGQTPAYEIMVQLDVIEGMLTDKNIKEIDCAYRGDKLTDSLIGLTNPRTYPWQLKKSARQRMFSIETKKWVDTVGTPPLVGDSDAENPLSAPVSKLLPGNVPDQLSELKEQQPRPQLAYGGDKNHRKISYKKKTYKKNTRKLYTFAKVYNNRQ